MNLQSYSTIYAQNHGLDFASVSNENIILTMDDTQFSKNYVLKLSNYKNIYDDSKPLIRGLLAFFKIEAPSTVFSTDDSWSLLIGNQKLIYPSHKGKTFCCATSLFVKEPSILKNMFSISYSENVYAYKNTIIYLDPFDIPSPGGNYFHSQQPNEYYRICYITLQVDNDLKHLFEDVKGVFNIPLKSKPAQVQLSPFVQHVPMNEISFTYYESTNIVCKNKCFKDPDLILHDILDSYPQSNEIGIIIQHPIEISFTASDECKNKKFLAFAVNCNAPKQVLFVPAPYDRYYQYRYPPSYIQWTHIYYDNVNFAKPVVISKNIIGYVYRDVFFCLLYPKLSNFRKNKNTQYLLNMLNFDIDSDPDLQRVRSYRFDEQHALVCVKHKNCHNELWCIEKKNQTMPKSTSPSYLVREWAELVLENANSQTFDITFVKLMFLLDKHQICYFTKEGKRDIKYEREKDIVFYLEKNCLDFINNLRQNVSERTIEEGCVIL